MNSDCQREILHILEENSLQISWLNGRVPGYSYNRLRYAIVDAKDMPYDLYKAILNAFAKAGITEHPSCETLIELTLNAGATLGDGIKKLNTEVMTDTADGKLTADERMRLRLRLDDLEANVNESIKQLRKYLNE